MDLQRRMVQPAAPEPSVIAPVPRPASNKRANKPKCVLCHAMSHAHHS